MVVGDDVLDLKGKNHIHVKRLSYHGKFWRIVLADVERLENNPVISFLVILEHAVSSMTSTRSLFNEVLRSMF